MAGSDSWVIIFRFCFLVYRAKLFQLRQQFSCFPIYPVLTDDEDDPEAAALASLFWVMSSVWSVELAAASARSSWLMAPSETAMRRSALARSASRSDFFFFNASMRGRISSREACPLSAARLAASFSLERHAVWILAGPVAPCVERHEQVVFA